MRADTASFTSLISAAFWESGVLGHGPGIPDALASMRRIGVAAKMASQGSAMRLWQRDQTTKGPL